MPRAAVETWLASTGIRQRYLRKAICDDAAVAMIWLEDDG